MDREYIESLFERIMCENLWSIVTKYIREGSITFENFKSDCYSKYIRFIDEYYKLDIEHSSWFMDSFIESVAYLSIYKTLIGHSTLKDIKRIVHQYYSEHMKENEEALLSTGARMFTDENISMLRESAKLSEEIKFQDDYIVEFLEGEEDSYNFGNNTYKCPINDFFKKHEASEFMIHICELDYIRSEYMKSGLDRKYCLAKGDTYCSFRWNKGKKPIWR